MNFSGTLSDTNRTWRAEKNMISNTLAKTIPRLTRL